MNTHALTEEAIRPAALMADKQSRLEADRRFLLDRRDRWVRVPCPACGADTAARYASKDTIDYARCTRCDTVYTNPRPSADLLAEFYTASQNYSYWNEHIFPATEDARRERIFAPRAARTAELVRTHNVHARTVVEIGAAFGTFLTELRALGVGERHVAIEPTPGLASTCRERGLETIEDIIERIDMQREADLVCAFEVIEHLHDPSAFIERCRRILRPGGLLILSCPNVRGFDIQRLGVQSGAFDHEHLNYFHPDSLAHLVRSRGLDVLETRTPGQLDADLVRQAVLRAEHSLDDDPLLHEVLIERWDDLGGPFQRFLAQHRLSSHLWLVARAPDRDRTP